MSFLVVCAWEEFPGAHELMRCVRPSSNLSWFCKGFYCCSTLVYLRTVPKKCSKVWPGARGRGLLTAQASVTVGVVWLQISEEDLYSSVRRGTPPTAGAGAAGPSQPTHGQGDTNGSLPPVKLPAWGNAGAGVAVLKCAPLGWRAAEMGCSIVLTLPNLHCVWLLCVLKLYQTYAASCLRAEKLWPSCSSTKPRPR